MQVSEVPQDELPYKDRDKVQKLVYATDAAGQYTNVPSAGWEAENAATKAAWDDVAETLRETSEAIKAGTLSPIAYFMHLRLMDVPLLAKYVGKWQWTVKRHMKPEVFKKLSRTILAQYAAVFNISIEELSVFRG